VDDPAARGLSQWQGRFQEAAHVARGGGPDGEMIGVHAGQRCPRERRERTGRRSRQARESSAPTPPLSAKINQVDGASGAPTAEGFCPSARGAGCHRIS
jgi:hypothetical protein